MNRDLIEWAAQTAHEANRQYCMMLGEGMQPRWEDAPEWQKSSARAGVEAILKNPQMTPSQSHESWMAQKKTDGWVYGPVKDAEKKEHPCMVPYSQLCVTQRFKDYLFQSVVRAVIAMGD